MFFHFHPFQRKHAVLHEPFASWIVMSFSFKQAITVTESHQFCTVTLGSFGISLFLSLSVEASLSTHPLCSLSSLFLGATCPVLDMLEQSFIFEV